MSETIEMQDEMSAAAVKRACRLVSAELGSRAETWLSLGNEYGDHCITVFMHPHGRTHGKTEAIRANTFPEAFDAAMEWAKTNKAVYRNAIIRQMALAIMEITDEHGECAEARLRAKSFSRDEITEFHAAACQRAGEMAMGTPFTVLMDVA